MKCALVKSFLLVGFLLVILTCAFAQNSIPSFLCDGVPTNKWVRNVTDCRGWIRCLADGPISGSCPDQPEQYFFDQQNQYCSKLEHVECYNCPDPYALLAYYPVPNSCNRYIRCLRNVATEFICGAGLQFNKITQKCEEGGGCTPSDSFQCNPNLKPGEFSAINDAANCSIGLVCAGNTEPRIEHCSGSLHFDIGTLMCVKPENSGCKETEPITTTTTTNLPTTTTTTNPPTATTTINPPTTTTTINPPTTTTTINPPTTTTTINPPTTTTTINPPTTTTTINPPTTTTTIDPPTTTTTINPPTTTTTINPPTTTTTINPPDATTTTIPPSAEPEDDLPTPPPTPGP